MSRTRARWVGLLGGALLTFAVTVSAAEKAEPVELGEKSVTVFPMAVTPAEEVNADVRRRIGEVVGMLLERSNMEVVRLSEKEFLPKPDDKIEAVAAAFGKFVAEQKIETAYGLLGEIRGTRKGGIEAMRTIVVDAKGNVVLAEEITQEAFAKSAPIIPKNPMTCCVFLVHRLRKPWGLADPMRSDAPQGGLQEKWRERSGLPDKTEVAAMEARAAKLRKELAEISLAVCPVYVSRKPQPQTAPDLAAKLDGEGFQSVSAMEKGPELNVPGSPNEQEVLWRTARQVRAYFQEHTPSAEYVLIADFCAGRSEGTLKVGAVHWILGDRQGDWVLVDYQNSHHSDFQRIEPDSIEDCLELVKIRFKKRLAAAK